MICLSAGCELQSQRCLQTKQLKMIVSINLLEILFWKTHKTNIVRLQNANAAFNFIKRNCLFLFSIPKDKQAYVFDEKKKI